MTQTRIAVTNRTICYELYKQAGLASAEDTPLTCLSRQIRVLLNNNSYDKILVREKDLSVEEYHEFIADIFSAQHSYRSATNLTSNNCTSPKNPLTINSRSDNSTLTKSICSDGFNIMSSRIIVHNFPAVAEEFGTDLHLPFSCLRIYFVNQAIQDKIIFRIPYLIVLSWLLMLLVPLL